MRHLLFLFLLAVVLFVPQQAQAAQPSTSNIVEIHTSKGVIVVELDEAKAPVTVANFKRYVDEGFYANTIFHRVIPNFMVQGGGLTAELKEKKTNSPIKNEADNGVPNVKYSIAMARTNIPNSATAQFFINTRDNTFLNYKSATPEGWGYCVFGKVIEGMAVVDSIEKQKTQTVGYNENVPVTPVIITNVMFR